MPDDMEESPVCSEVGMPDYLGVFTTSMKTYRRFSEHLPVNGHVVDLANGAKKASDVVGETNESDYFGVMIRLMLQRKYFQRGGDHKKPNPLFIRNLVKTAQGSYPDQSDTWQHVLERLDDLKKCEVQVSLPDGTVQAGFFDNVQDVTYGALLHADPDKLERVAQIPESMQTIYVGEYVMARERILVDFSDALQASGVKTLDSHKTERKASVYMGLQEGSVGRSISGSPCWSGLVGRDMDDDEIADTVLKSDSLEDLYVIQVCSQFVSELLEDQPDVTKLSAMVAPWLREEWGDFSEAAQKVKNVRNIGFSHTVDYRDGGIGAVVKMLPDVEAAFCVEGPQLIEDGEVGLVKTGQGWKVMRLYPPQYGQ